MVSIGIPHEGRSRFLIVLLCVAILLGGASVMADTIYGTADVFPNYMCGSGNPTLISLYPAGTFTQEVKIEEGREITNAGWHYFPNEVNWDFKINAIYNNEGEWETFDWVSKYPIKALLVKTGKIDKDDEGSCYWVYEYPSGAYHGEGLEAPPVGDPIKGISHADFGFSVPEFPLMVCGMLSIMGVLGMIYYQKSKKE